MSSPVTIGPNPDQNTAPGLKVDTTVSSTSPSLLSAVAMLVKMGAPQPTFVDQLVFVPQFNSIYPNNLVIFTGLVDGKQVTFTDNAYMVAAFPYSTFNGLRAAGLVTPNADTPTGLVLDHYTNDPPMVYDPHKVINGVGPNPGDYSQALVVSNTPGVTLSASSVAPGVTFAVNPSTAVGSRGIFGGQ